MTGLILVAAALVSQVDGGEATLTVRSQVRGARVCVNQIDIGPVNKRLKVFVPEGEKTTRVTVTKKGYWDVVFGVKLTPKKSFSVKIPRMVPGVTLVGNELDAQSLRTSQTTSRGGGKGQTITKTRESIEIKGDPFVGDRVTTIVNRVRNVESYVLRFDYLIDKGTKYVRSNVFGMLHFPMLRHGIPHTVIVVVGPDYGWLIIDYKSVLKLTTMNVINLAHLDTYYERGSKGRFVLSNWYFKELDAETFAKLAKIYKQGGAK